MTGNTYLEMKLLRNPFSFCYNNQGNSKRTDFQKFSNKEIYFTVQSNNTKYIERFNSISGPNVMEGYHNLSPDI